VSAITRSARGNQISVRRLSAISVLLAATVGCSADAPVTPVVTPPVVTVLEPVTNKLPILSISTANGARITSKEVYVPASLALTDTSGATLLQASLEIRGRGNTTWELLPKKPYRLKLTTASSVLGMPSNRHWVLLANYSDKTLLRNDITFALSRMAGMAWTPRSQFVQLRVNDQYDGVYQLAEHVRVGTDRVNIQEMKVADTSASAITGGYMIETDERRGEDFCFNSTITAMVFCVGNPETLLLPAWSKQRAYIQNYIARTDSALFGAQFADTTVGYRAYIDMESAVNYYLIQEIVKNVDGNFRFGAFMYKPRGGKLTFGPVWDFDLAIGNVNYQGADTPTGWYVRNSMWYTRLFQDPAFRARVTERWNELRRDGTITALQRMIYSRGNYLALVQRENFNRWPILATYVWPNRVVTGSYEGELTAANTWLETRLAWLTQEFAR
jgi:hypothetical protein